MSVDIDQIRDALSDPEDRLRMRAMGNSSRWLIECVEEIERLRASAEQRLLLLTGVVIDAGGGVVEVWVDRNTDNYPAVGTRVSLCGDES